MLEKKKDEDKKQSWIENICGTFENDKLYDEAMRLGELHRTKS
jgi:hypothetical protein